MKRTMTTIIALLITVASSQVLARNDIQDYSIEEALFQEQAKEQVGNEIRFYFGKQKHGKVLKSWGEFATNKKTNAFLKSDQEACTWAFLSALKALRDRALREGGNAVIDIKSNYKGRTTVSDSAFQCGAGNIIAGVALKGTVVKLP